MSIRHLGETFDIHGGGMDLIFPHHENEIAQSCGATGKEFARYWIHNGFVQINKEKMSKSLGNFFTIREIFDKSEWPDDITGETLRYFLLSTHYHGPLDFSDHAIKEAKNALNSFYDLFGRLAEPGGNATGDQGLSQAVGRSRETFAAAMDDDFNTPVALAALQGLRSDVNKMLEQGLSIEARRAARNEFRSRGNVLGLFQSDEWQFNPVSKEQIRYPERNQSAGSVPAFSTGGLSDAEITQKVAERTAAKQRKDFKKADEIRADLKLLGIIIEDKPDGTSRWKR
jgi:cysteinyl-tRNA synthetase